MNNYLSVRETAEKWDMSTRRVQVLVSEGRIPGVERIGNMWVIPEEAEKPRDARVKSGKYMKDKDLMREEYHERK